MAKTQIKNYVFKPGLGATGSLYPNAYSLINANKSFIQKEMSAYIADKVAAAAQYSPTGATYAPATGVLVLTIGTHNFNVGDAIIIANGGITFTNASAGAVPFFDKALIITAVSANTSVTVNAGISTDLTAHSWVSSVANATQDVFFNYTNTSVLKCERDVGYVVDAYLKDLRYGGNENVYNTIKYYWDQTVAQVDGDRGAELSAHNFIGRLIKDYILTKTSYPASNTEVTQTITGTASETTAQFTPTGATYTPTTGTMSITIGTHTLAVGDEIHIAPGGITFTCALDGGATLHPYPRAFGVPNTKGKDPYYYAPITITSVTSTTITVSVGISSDTSVHTFDSAVANSVTAGPSAKVNTLVFNTVDVISNGLNALPKFIPTGVGTIKIQGRYDLDQLLLITNVTSNDIIYNFSAPATGGLVSLKTDKISNDTDFVKYLETTDAITTITLNFDTSHHFPTDELQLFVEELENGKSVVTTRPFDFGTDAIERLRVAQPQSMLDADFEYGLQPTKWAAIATMRGYPSVYEVPGTDTPVLSVVTDASAGTDGIGQSLITVTTVGPHNIPVGTPITIKALEDSVAGAARAEGSFVIVEVPTTNTFTFYAKSKVGTVNPTTLSTTYTQLRQGGFYTGANIGEPTVAVVSNGSAGTLVAELDIATGSTIIPYDGPSPEVGSPLTNAAIPTGSQVTSIIDTSAGGGEYLIPLVTTTLLGTETSMEVEDATGIVPNLAIDRGDGTAIYVNNVVGSTVNMTGAFTTNLIANNESYTNIAPTSNTPSGNNLLVNISTSGGSYTLAGIQNTGENYQIGDRIVISGTDLGGNSPTNDLVMVVDTVDSANGIATVSLTGNAVSGSETFSNLTGTYQYGLGTDAQFDVTYVNNVYNLVDVSSPDLSSGYQVGDIIVLDGAVMGGTTVTHDVTIQVDSIGAGGGVVSLTATGTAPDAALSFNNPSSTTNSVSGTGAQFNVDTAGAVYSITVLDDPGDSLPFGDNYLPGETITVLGADVGGVTPANNLTITIDNVNGNGAPTAVSATGTAYNGNVFTGRVGNNRIGTGAQFNVVLAAGAYTPTISVAGTGYNVGQTIVIAGGSDLPGSSPANDLTITITAVDDISTGVITTISHTGTAITGTATYYGVTGTTSAVTGTGLRIDVTRIAGAYSSVTINNGGSGYSVGNSFNIEGTVLNGTSPVNDVYVRITSVDGSGIATAIIDQSDSAQPGNQFRFISTVVVTEATTAPISQNAVITYGALATLEITLNNAHGLVPGDTFIVTSASDDGTNNHALSAGSFFATDIPAVNKLRYQARATGTIDATTSSILGTLYSRPDSFFVHRPYDGGVQLGTGGPQHGAQAIRQSKKYIRYQSGKGIMYTTGALFAPSYDLRSLTADGVEVNSLITIETDDNDHGVQVGGVIRILGVETPGFNSGNETAVPPVFDYTVESIIDERRFTVRAQRRLGATTAILGFGSQMSVVSWHGATVRSGIFDDQNGIFWEFDGTQISVAQRTGTRQLAGTIALEVDDNLVTGTNTRFTDQLKAGDRIIIKGMTHVVSHVNSQTEITVTPDFRGVVNISGAKANLIVDKKTKQKDFNLDKLDGTGPSGYNIDIAKMQMIGIQYSWYGAGFIDFMLRGADGNFVFAHRMRNSNVNTEAFMRSGNLPVRYEVANEGPSGKLSAALDASQVTIPLTDSSFFPDYGTVYIDNEIMTFSGNNKTTNTLTGITRGATFTNFQAGATRSYTAAAATTHTDRTGVVLISQTVTPLISHWGSAFITDGMFDDDRGYIFSYAENQVNVSTTKQSAFLIRLSPSVSNALIGDLGERELLNRAQLLLQGIEVTSDGIDVDNTNAPIVGGIVVEGILNPQNYPLNPADIGWTGLSGVAQGGQPSFAQIASGGSVNWSTGDAATTATATASAAVSTTMDSGQYTSAQNRNYVFVSVSDYNTTFGTNSLTPVQGKTITNGGSFNNIRPNTTITGGYMPSSGTYGYFRLSQNTTNNNSDRINSNTSNAYVVSTADVALVNRNFAYFAKASFEASGAGIGTELSDGGTVNFPANTLVNSIDLLDFGGTEYYEVQFNNAFVGTLAVGSGTIEFTFVQPPYAQPGETVFSFIATPGERASLDLSQLKELTNTPLGGRGTYPNGPDVLALNVYKVGGAATDANIILRWGEAQA
jgi:hypothetical protein